jgi:hypothetical protein
MARLKSCPFALLVRPELISAPEGAGCGEPQPALIGEVVGPHWLENAAHLCIPVLTGMSPDGLELNLRDDEFFD